MTLPHQRRYRHLRYPGSLHDWVRGFSLHVLTGFIAVAAHYSLMWLLLRAGVEAVLASAAGFLAGAATRFVLSYLKVFSPSGGVPVTVLRFVAALGLQMLANTAILDGLLRLGLGVWAAQVVTTVVLTFGNYLVYRLWVFR